MKVCFDPFKHLFQLKLILIIIINLNLINSHISNESHININNNKRNHK
jgi:hypothetical protein